MAGNERRPMSREEQLELRKKKKRKRLIRRLIVRLVMVVLFVAAVLLLFWAGKSVYRMLTSRTETDLPSTSLYETTPEKDQNKVAYYVVGLMGEDIEDDLTALSLVCWDKKANTMNVLQIPCKTYIGDSDIWAVNYAAGVWGNPKPLTWCETCRKQVFAPEIGEDGRHTVCGTTLTTREGSSKLNLLTVFNEQYSMPVDEYFLFPQTALVDLIDNVGGIDLLLGEDLTVDDTTYEAGTRTLDGAAALYYAIAYHGGDTPEEDVQRMLCQRTVFAALFERLLGLDEDDMDDAIRPVLNGETPIRSGIQTSGIVDLLTSMNKITMEAVTAYILPGETTDNGYYSAHKAELATLLQERFNPYGAPITEGYLQTAELVTPSGESDLHAQTFREILVDQTGTLEDSEETSEEDTDGDAE